MAGARGGSGEQARGASGCVIAFLVVIVAGLGFVALRTWQVVDGLDGDVTAPDFDPDAPEVASARATADAEVMADLDVVGAASSALHPIGDRGRRVGCDRGDATWMYEDQHAFTCTATAVQVFSFGGSDARSSMDGIVRDLSADSCGEGQRSEAAEAIADLVEPDDVVGGAVWCSTSGDAEGPEVVAWASLPMAPDQRRDIESLVDLQLPRSCSSGEADGCTADPLELEEALAAAPPRDRWAVVVSSSTAYWTVDWE